MGILNKDLKETDNILLLCGIGRSAMRLIRKKANLQNYEESKIDAFDSRIPLHLCFIYFLISLLFLGIVK